MSRRRRIAVLVLLTVTIAVVLRVALSLRPGIWADEVFSLAMATGHSVEHPAAVADPERGDFVEPREAMPAGFWTAYLELGSPPAGLGRIIRAVRLSDTNPPVYYVVLSGWARLAGTGDHSLRLFSVLWAVASLPLLWLVAREVGGRRVAVTALVLFSFSPVALHYSTEGRMYAMGWFLGLLLALQSLRLARLGPRPAELFLFTIAGVAALLTHYFLAFAWLACLAWLLVHPGKLPRRHTLAAVIVTGLLIFPWYLQVPASLATWRVSSGWLDYPLTLRRAVLAPPRLAWSLLSGHGSWGGSIPVDIGLALAYVGLGVFVLWTGARQILQPRARLIWFWLAAAILGILVFDLLRGTSASLVSRYAVLGLPGAMVLAALAAHRLPRRAAVAFLVLVLLAWASGIRDSFSPLARPHQPFPAVAASLASANQRPDVVLVHSIPTGVLGLARYLPEEMSVASWIVRLEGRRIPDDLRYLLQGRCRAALVKIHDLGDVSPAEEWLRANAVLEAEELWRFRDRWTVAESLTFRPATSDPSGAMCGDW